MIIFLTILAKLIPLYIIIGLGFIAGKYLHVKKESIAPLTIYIIAPIIVFNAALTTQLTLSILTLPLLIYIIACIMCLTFFYIGKFIWKDTTRNILAFIAGDANTGYFGIPVAIILFDQNLLNIYILGTLGLHIFENSLGFFITARGHHTIKESLIKLVKLPTLYAFFIGLIFNLFGLHFGSIYSEAVLNFRGAYIILGMIIIGLGLASIVKFEFDLKFISLSFFAKFFAWPLIMLAVIIVNKTIFHIFEPNIYRVMILLSIAPIATNTVAFATELNAQPEKAALTVFLSTLFALFYVPLIATLFLS